MSHYVEKSTLIKGRTLRGDDYHLLSHPRSFKEPFLAKLGWERERGGWNEGVNFKMGGTISQAKQVPSRRSRKPRSLFCSRTWEKAVLPTSESSSVTCVRPFILTIVKEKICVILSHVVICHGSDRKLTHYNYHKVNTGTQLAGRRVINWNWNQSEKNFRLNTLSSNYNFSIPHQLGREADPNPESR